MLSRKDTNIILRVTCIFLKQFCVVPCSRKSREKRVHQLCLRRLFPADRRAALSAKPRIYYSRHNCRYISAFKINVSKSMPPPAAALPCIRTTLHFHVDERLHYVFTSGGA